LNVEWISSCPAPVRIGGYFTLQRLIGSRIFQTWREWQKWERLSASELDDAVESRLSRLLAKANRESEYYRKLGLQRTPDETAEQFLARFPILGREQVRSCFCELVIDSLRNEIVSSDSCSKKRYDWLVVKTGGTTGVPTAVCMTQYSATGGALLGSILSTCVGSRWGRAISAFGVPNRNSWRKKINLIAGCCATCSAKFR
jgi:hypothetical protein